MKRGEERERNGFNFTFPEPTSKKESGDEAEVLFVHFVRLLA